MKIFNKHTKSILGQFFPIAAFRTLRSSSHYVYLRGRLLYPKRESTAINALISNSFKKCNPLCMQHIRLLHLGLAKSPTIQKKALSDDKVLMHEK